VPLAQARTRKIPRETEPWNPNPRRNRSSKRSRARSTPVFARETARITLNARHSGVLFGIRNAKRSLAKTPCIWATIFGNTRGRRIGSGRLPELRRFWICCEARGLEREVRWRRVYPDEMSRMRGHRPKAPYLTYDRRLTARPAVLAKRTEPDRHTSRPTVDGPART